MSLPSLSRALQCTRHRVAVRPCAESRRWSAAFSSAASALQPRSPPQRRCGRWTPHSASLHSSTVCASAASGTDERVSSPTSPPSSSSTAATSTAAASSTAIPLTSSSAVDSSSLPSSPSPPSISVAAPFTRPSSPPLQPAPPNPPASYHLLRIPNLKLGRATLSRWLVPPSASFTPGQALCELDSDLAVIDYKAQDGGWMAVHAVREGEAVRADEVVAVVCEREEELQAAREEWERRAKEREKRREDSGQEVEHSTTEEIAALRE